ncbi:hypothetical protein F5Y13DRAFT_102746 [Hypoxylon sp. FL1857]|nr:hypothetical protein F5Y13DRAFT_102746 [Hypoxylon sp. FL1857]
MGRNEPSNQQRLGLRKVVPTEGDTDNTTVDIIAIHGLDTESPRTWTYKKDGSQGVNWLDDRRMLPAAVPSARIYTYDWNAKVFDNAPVQTLLSHADNLLALVAAEHGASNRPILFIASCFGGLVLAEAICRAAQEGSKYRKILQSTIGIVFLATPFFGTDAARPASWLVVVKGIMGKEASNQLIKDLEERHAFVRERVQKFAEIANDSFIRLPIWCFYETRKTKIAKKILPAWISEKWSRGSILVTESSACLHGFHRQRLERKHLMMNKFGDPECRDFILVKEAIHDILEKAPNTLKYKEKSKIARKSIESDTRAATKEQQTRFLQSLRFPSMNERKNDIVGSHSETFRWVFRANSEDLVKFNSGNFSPLESATSDNALKDASKQASAGEPSGLEDKPWYNFEDWLKSDNAIYWINGKLGSGKTTLMKYLIENRLTKESLATWAKDPVILSHFFWKAGSKLQGNIKGCLCTILYQALYLNTTPLNSILTPRNRSLLAKESVTDWSRKELKDVCFAVLRSYPSSVCIFLDGLDEICLEDRSSLIELVETLGAFPNIKVCVSSRPEPHLLSALLKYPHLKLQDLTLNDMREYASAKIQPYVSNGQISKDTGSDITNLLLRKAEGVFLWLRLASDSLVRGLMNNDPTDILYQRLREMPNDLYKLYDDMWSRMNEDTRLYRETAARYFNLAIASQREVMRSISKLRLLHLMAATNHKVQHTFINKGDTINATSLIRECDETVQEIQRRCIGLLEVVPKSGEEAETWDPTRYDTLLPYWEASVQFIHRTAYDFLTDTEGGHRILACDLSSKHERSFQMMKGGLVMKRLIKSYRFPSIHDNIDILSQLAGAIPSTAIDEALRAMWDLYDNGHYVDDTPRPHFLAIAARVLFKKFVLSNIASSPNPSSLATDVLRYKCTPQINRHRDFLDELSYFWEPLLALNADINAKGTCYITNTAYGYTRKSHMSPIGRFLVEIFTRGYSIQEVDARYRQLQRFMDAGPDLQQRIPLFIQISEGVLAVKTDFEEPMVSSVILDVDLAFLVEAYSKRARRRAMPLSIDDSVDQHPREASKTTSPRVVLIRVYKDDYFYQCLSDEAMKQLLALLIQFLYGDQSGDLARKTNQEFKSLGTNIRGSTKFKEAGQTPVLFLAERNLGYCLP